MPRPAAPPPSLPPPPSAGGTRRRRLLAAGGGGAGAIALALLSATPASAHVRVSSPDASAGAESGALVFRVPTESETASTVSLSVELPAATPFAFVSARQLPGWQVTAPEQELGTTVKSGDFSLTKAVTRVTWTASAAAGVPPGEYQEFSLSVGPFPSGVSEMTFPATQTYSDGTVVRWNQPAPANGAEAEDPVPSLSLPVAAAPAPAASDDSTDTTARALGIGGIVVGALGALGAAGSLLRRRAA